MKFVTLILLLSSNLVAQNWHEKIISQAKLIEKITKNENWNSILEFAIKDLTLSEASLTDIKQTIEFKASKSELNVIDLFFHNICDSAYTEFPYRKSGHLTQNLFSTSSIGTSLILPSLRAVNGRSLYPKFAEIINIEEEILVPELIKYLDNDAATRLCVRPIDSGEPPYYLSLSDVAMELLEVKTLCDFFDNASHSQKLFSNITVDEKNEIIKDIEDWRSFSNDKTQFQKIEYFLDSICDLGHSYRYTCHNLLFSGDTIGAKKMYTVFYERTKMPCRQDYEVGEILLELGDRRILYDCSDKIYNYKCSNEGWESLGINCVDILFKSDEAWFRDDIFAEIIATEPHSTYRGGRRNTFIWQYIFGNLPNQNERFLIKTLIELMKRQDELNSLNTRFTEGWKSKYPEQAKLNYRVCDFALIEYSETIQALVKLKGGSIEKRHMMEKIIEEMQILNWESIEERQMMIKKITEKYED